MVRWASGPVTFAVLIVFLAGCGGGSSFKPKLAPVTGTVTVDGKPAAGLMVSFEPLKDHQPGDKTKEVGQPSTGSTDASGKYTLQYGGGGAGAIVGKHLMRVEVVAGNIAADAEAVPPSNIKIPEKYALGTLVEVKDGPNTHDLDVKTK